MKAFAEYNPIVLTVYFLSVCGVSMFCMHPVVTGISLCGALLLYFLRNGRRQGKSHLYFLGMFLLLSLLNPLVSHQGATVLFVMNHNPVTLEALLYGICASANLLAVLYWFRSFSQIMTRDKLLYVFGRLSPKFSLVLSMAIRYVSLFSQQAKKVTQAQKALGLYRDDSLFDRIRGGLRVFSILLTWALENGIITADSMAARGYGVGKRTNFALFRFRRADVLLLLCTILLTGILCTGLGLGALEFSFYPAAAFSECTYLTVGSDLAFGMLVLLPSIIETKEVLKWKFLLSNI